jgi:hypothetical protein
MLCLDVCGTLKAANSFKPLKTMSTQCVIIARVTRLGEFSPIGRWFTLGIPFKITDVALKIMNKVGQK